MCSLSVFIRGHCQDDYVEKCSLPCHLDETITIIILTYVYLCRFRFNTETEINRILASSQISKGRLRTIREREKEDLKTMRVLEGERERVGLEGGGICSYHEDVLGNVSRTTTARWDWRKPLVTVCCDDTAICHSLLAVPLSSSGCLFRQSGRYACVGLCCTDCVVLAGHWQVCGCRLNAVTGVA